MLSLWLGVNSRTWWNPIFPNSSLFSWPAKCSCLWVPDVMLEARGAHHYASNATTEELQGWVRILPTHRPAAESCQRKEIKKQPRTDQSAEIFWVDDTIKKKLSCQQLCKHGVMHVTRSLKRSFPHQKHMLEVLKSSLWKEMFLITTLPILGCEFSSV